VCEEISYHCCVLKDSLEVLYEVLKQLLFPQISKIYINTFLDNDQTSTTHHMKWIRCKTNFEGKTFYLVQNVSNDFQIIEEDFLRSHDLFVPAKSVARLLEYSIDLG
jgi:hypothetical protein